jgi:hypothetical protein
MTILKAKKKKGLDRETNPNGFERKGPRRQKRRRRENRVEILTQV